MEPNYLKIFCSAETDTYPKPDSSASLRRFIDRLPEATKVDE